MNRTVCKDCAFSVVALAGPQSAQPGLTCRRQPPVPHVLAHQTAQGLAVQVLTVWPTVQAGDWCGDAEPTARVLKPN